MTSAAPMQDDTDVLLKLFQEFDHGPSPWGISTHSGWIECGKRAALRQAEREAKAANDEPEVVQIGDKLNYMRVGLYVHKMFEARILRQLGDDLIWDARASVFTPDFLEAIRLYRAYHQHWGSIEEKWGAKVLACEMPLGDGAVEAAVRAKLGGPLTGRADAVIEIVDPERARANTGVTLMPGRYIFDYKCSKAHGSNDASKFGPDNLQAQAYLWLDTVERGEDGALGVIFERLIGHTEIRKVPAGKSAASYASFVVYPQLDSEERLRALVQLSLRAQANPVANPLACTDGYGRPCYFKTAGICKGY